MNVQFTEKTESIFRNTLLLIKERGFHGTPMSQIAKSADVAIGTIYHYFPSKENLIIELFYYCKEKLHIYIFQNINENDSYKSKFSTVFKRFCEFYLHNETIFSFMEQFYNSPFYDLQNQDKKDGPYEENKVVSFLLKGIEIDILLEMDKKILSAVYIGTAVTYAKSIVYRKEKYNENDVENLIEIIWNGLKKI